MAAPAGGGIRDFTNRLQARVDRTVVSRTSIGYRAVDHKTLVKCSRHLANLDKRFSHTGAFCYPIIAGRSLHATRALRAGHPQEFLSALLRRLFPCKNSLLLPGPPGCPPFPYTQR
jgi:hypothetical protein